MSDFGNSLEQCFTEFKQTACTIATGAIIGGGIGAGIAAACGEDTRNIACYAAMSAVIGSGIGFYLMPLNEVPSPNILFNYARIRDLATEQNQANQDLVLSPALQYSS